MKQIRSGQPHAPRRGGITLTLACALLASASPAAGAEPNDAFGDPLPSAAVARAGTIRSAGDLPDGFVLPSSVRGAVFSPDNKLLATRGEPSDASARRVIRIWDARTGKLSRSLKAFSQPVTALAFSADSHRLISATPNHPQGTQVWNVADGRLLRSLPGGRGQFFLSPNGRTASIVERFQKNEVIRTFDLESGNETARSIVDVSHRFQFSPGGAKMLARNSERETALRLLDIATGKQIARLEGERGTPGTMSFSADGRTVAVAVSRRTGRDSAEHLVVLWELASQRPAFELSGHSKRVLALGFSPDGRYLVSGSADRSVRVWEVATGKEVHTFAGHGGPVAGIDVSPDGTRLASGSFDRTVLVWNLKSVNKTFLASQPLDAASFNRLWDELSAVSPANAYRAIGQLRLDETAAANLLHRRIESIVRPVQADRIRQLIADLEHDDYIVRFRATRQLQKLREIARPLLLKEAQETASAEVLYRIRRVLTGAEETPRFSTADVRRITRVIHVLEYLPGETAEAALEAIIDDFPAAEVVKDARETLARLRGAE